MVLHQMMAPSTHLFVARKENKKGRRIQKYFFVEGEGVQESSLLKMQAVELYKVCFWSIEYSIESWNMWVVSLSC